MLSEKDKMLSGEFYNASEAELVEERRRARKILQQFNNHNGDDSQSEKLLLKKLIPDGHDDLSIQAPFHCEYGYNITCGQNVSFKLNCVVLDAAKVTIGSNVFFGPGVQIYTATHPLDHEIRRTLEFGKQITIGDDCWIGGGTIIMPGVTIGSRCIIGAGSIVVKDLPDDSVAIGNVAKVIRSIIKPD